MSHIFHICQMDPKAQLVVRTILRAEVQKLLDDGVNFITDIRGFASAFPSDLLIEGNVLKPEWVLHITEIAQGT